MQSRYSTLKQTIIYLLLTGYFTSSTLLAERWYEVEVILFEQATEERLLAETWDRMPPLPDVSTSRDFISLPPHLQSLDAVCVNGRLFNVKPLPTPEEVIPEPLISEITVDESVDTGQIELNLSSEQDNDVTDLQDDPVTKEPEKPFQLLTADDRQLKNVYQQLRRRRGYRMLFHEVWRQPMSRKRDSQPIRIYAGKNFSDQFNYAGDALVELAESDNETSITSPLNYLNDFSQLGYSQTTVIPVEQKELFDQNQVIVPMMDMDHHFSITRIDKARDRVNECATQDSEMRQKAREPVWQIDGYLKVYAERFRHVETNLVVRIPGQEEVDLRAIATNLAAEEMVASIDLADDSVQSSYDWQFDENFLSPAEDKQTLIRDVLKHYSMQQSRRIIDEKIHYLDHPLLGMIIQMRRYDPDENEDDL